MGPSPGTECQILSLFRLANGTLISKLANSVKHGNPNQKALFSDIYFTLLRLESVCFFKVYKE